MKPPASPKRRCGPSKNLGKRQRPRTRTSPFGAPGRISHDASAFYASRLYEGLEGNGQTTALREESGAFEPEEIESGQGEAALETCLPLERLDRFYCQSSAAMEALPPGSVHLMVTSPPYNAQKEYDSDLNLAEYLALLESVWRETYRVLAPGGRACINVANLGRKPYIPLHAHLIGQMEKLGFRMRGEIIWNKASSSSPSTAWGSWQSASNPVLRDVHEYILIFSKGSFRRERRGRESTIRREEFLEWTKSVWNIPAVSAKKVGHPAPFPEELPHRLIQLYTFREDVVLDPFAGSGTTCLAAKRDGRHWVGYEINPAYIELAEKRLAQI